jgi:hypothetical protein
MLGKSYVVVVSVLIQIALIFVNRLAPPVRPEWIKNGFTDALAVISAFLTAFLVTVFPAKASVAAVAAVILVLSMLPSVRLCRRITSS